MVVERYLELYYAKHLCLSCHLIFITIQKGSYFILFYFIFITIITFVYSLSEHQ